ncbi:estradiol 17-beta-dehydrogenase 2-like [Brevipalpus obovatus]|uniref:estradiol 17-beta-dehydrogenase 2-like n=1 Tax=Brevipalpus obovatus TaxID=246614 RepID=UPI003D9E6B05
MNTLKLSILFLPVTVFILIKLISHLSSLVSLITTPIVIVFLAWKLSCLVAKKVQALLDTNGKTVLITGCDSGIGLQTALELNRNGFNVIAACLQPNGEGSNELRKHASNVERLHIVGLDVTSSEETLGETRQKVDEILSATDTVLWGLVNNAGLLSIGYPDWGKGEKLVDNVIKVNLIGTIRVTRTFLPLLRKSKGRIVNMSSITAKLPLPFVSIYATTKAALISFSDSLRLSQLRWGVKVISIMPAKYRTQMSSSEGAMNLVESTWNSSSEEVKEDYAQEYPSLKKLIVSSAGEGDRDPIEVSRAIQYALQAQDPEDEIVCGPLSIKFVMFASSLIPKEWIDMFFELFDSGRLLTR